MKRSFLSGSSIIIDDRYFHQGGIIVYGSRSRAIMHTRSMGRNYWRENGGQLEAANVRRWANRKWWRAFSFPRHSLTIARVYSKQWNYSQIMRSRRTIIIIFFFYYPNSLIRNVLIPFPWNVAQSRLTSIFFLFFSFFFFSLYVTFTRKSCRVVWYCFFGKEKKKSIHGVASLINCGYLWMDFYEFGHEKKGFVKFCLFISSSVPVRNFYPWCNSLNNCYLVILVMLVILSRSIISLVSFNVLWTCCICNLSKLLSNWNGISFFVIQVWWLERD